MQTYTGEIEELKKKVNDKEEECKELKKQVAAKEDECKSQVLMLTQEKQTDFSSDGTSTKSNSRTQDDESEGLVLMQKKQAELSGDTTSAEANSGTQDAVIEALRTELQTIKSKIQESEIERVSVKDMKLESDAELHKRRMLLINHQQQLAAKGSEINMAGQELRNVETKVQEIEEELKTAKQNLASKDAEILSLTQARQKMESSILEMKVELNNAKQSQGVLETLKTEEQKRVEMQRYVYVMERRRRRLMLPSS